MKTILHPALVWLLLALPAQAQGPALPLHGNYCGIGHSTGLPPIDALDAACMRHDICAAQRGTLDCGCDIGFMNELRAQPWPDPVLADKARAIYDSIGMTPCADPSGMAYKMACVASDWMQDVMSGREMPTDIFRRWSQIGSTGLSNGYWNGR